MPRKAWLLQLSRSTHLYFGVLISPALLFFAFTGAVQTFGYHEPSSNYKPPALLASLGQLHKKQTYIVPQRRQARSPELTNTTVPSAAIAPTRLASEDRGGNPSGAHVRTSPSAAALSSGSMPGGGDGRPAGQQPLTLQAKQKQHLPLKIFFVLVSLGLATSTGTGIYMAYKYNRNKVLVTLLLLAGAILPVLLAPL